MNNHLEQVLNRRPSKWGNITIKEFEQDIRLLTNTVLELRSELKQETEKKNLYLNRWITGVTEYLEIMNEVLPEWREHSKDEIKQLKSLL